MTFARLHRRAFRARVERPPRKPKFQSFGVMLSVFDVDARRLLSCHLTSCHLTSCHLISCHLTRLHPGYRATARVWESAASSPGGPVGPLGQGWGQIDSEARSRGRGGSLLMPRCHLQGHGPQLVRRARRSLVPALPLPSSEAKNPRPVKARGVRVAMRRRGPVTGRDPRRRQE